MILNALIVILTSAASSSSSLDTVAWRFDLKFDVECGANSFSVLGAMLFDDKGKNAGVVFDGGYVHQPYLYAQLDHVPDMKNVQTSISVIVRSESNSPLRWAPHRIVDLRISFMHMGTTFKRHYRNIHLKNDTTDFTQLSALFPVDLSDFDRVPKNDCFFDAMYYLHGEVTGRGIHCSTQTLMCRCDNGVISQNCVFIPKQCFRNGQHFSKADVNLICAWKMQKCCAEVDCPVEPLTYCVSSAKRTSTTIVILHFLASVAAVGWRLLTCP